MSREAFTAGSCKTWPVFLLLFRKGFIFLCLLPCCPTPCFLIEGNILIPVNLLSLKPLVLRYPHIISSTYMVNNKRCISPVSFQLLCVFSLSPFKKSSPLPSLRIFSIPFYVCHIIPGSFLTLLLHMLCSPLPVFHVLPLICSTLSKAMTLETVIFNKAHLISIPLKAVVVFAVSNYNATHNHCKETDAIVAESRLRFQFH